MNVGAATPARRTDGLTAAAVVALGAVSLVLVFVGDGDLGLALAPLVLTLVLLAVAYAPLRASLLAAAFLALVLENPNEAFAAGQWRSPVAILGALYLNKLNNTLPVSALVFSGVEVTLALFVGVLVARRMNGSTVDVRGAVPAARPLRLAGWVALTTIGVVWAFGMARPGFSFGNSLWQVFRVLYLPIVFLLCSAALRGPADARPFAAALLGAAVVRAAVAVYVRQKFPDLEAVPHATTHFDSMLFADAFFLAIVAFLERPGRRTLLLFLAVVPIVTLGMIANHRRIAWVELLVGLALVYVLTPWTRLKKRFAQTVVLSLPILLAYVAVGWNAQSRIFGPVRTLRSVVDSKADTSTLWRDWENYNLYFTLKQNPALGTGFGHEYIEAIHLPDISQGYSLYRYAPHNAVLGLVTYSGFVGFAGLWMLLPLGIFFGVRAYRFSSRPTDRVAALTCVAVLTSYVVQCYGDMALGSWTSVFTVGPALALIGKQAIATGAWPVRRKAAT